MSDSARPSLPAVFAVGAFGLLSVVGGWLIVLGGGFYHSPGKYSSNAIFYDGAPAVLMASIQFLAAALAFFWLLRWRVGFPASSLIAFGLVFVPPLLYVLLGR